MNIPIKLGKSNAMQVPVFESGDAHKPTSRASLSTGKFLLFSFLSISLPVASIALIAEAALRLLPVQSATEQSDVDYNQPVARFQPNNNITFSTGWNFKTVVEHRINNDGFANRKDYVLNTNAKPTVAVVGDSYVEAFQVPFENSFHGLMQEDFANGCNVYSFGISGAPLSQYIAWAKHARQNYQPSTFLFNIVSNDFDESFRPYNKGRKGYWLYDRNPDGAFDYVLVPKKASSLKKVIRISALARYLFANVQLFDRTREFFKRIEVEHDNISYIGNRRADFTEEEMDISKKIVDQFLDDIVIATQLSPQSIIFTVDGLRQAIYGDITWGEAERSYAWNIKSYFIDQARLRGFTTVDLNEAFTAAEFQKSAKRFEFPFDWHWNEHGHAAVFNEIRKLDWSQCGKAPVIAAAQKP